MCSKSSMTIWAGHGDRICFEFLTRGYDCDIQQAKDFLEHNAVYTVEQVNVGSFMSTVLLQEVPNVYFNTIVFSDVEIDEEKAEARQREFYYKC